MSFSVAFGAWKSWCDCQRYPFYFRPSSFYYLLTRHGLINNQLVHVTVDYILDCTMDCTIYHNDPSIQHWTSTDCSTIILEAEGSHSSLSACEDFDGACTLIQEQLNLAATNPAQCTLIDCVSRFSILNAQETVYRVAICPTGNLPYIRNYPL